MYVCAMGKCEGANDDITDGREQAPLFRINEHRRISRAQANNIPMESRQRPP